MLNIAMVPDVTQFFHNSILESAEEFVSLKIAFAKLGCNLNTIDEYKDIRDCDAFLFWNGLNSTNYGWFIKILKLHMENRCIYWMLEPEAVIIRHSKAGLKRIMKYFRFIITWNSDLVDNKRVFHVNFLQNLYPVREINVDSFYSRKLLTNISGCKTSSCVDELYSQRLKVIQYFEKEHGDEFRFFGVGWDKEIYKNYGGTVKSKDEIYQMFKFALALENQKNVRGYISEKKIDCFKAGIIPIYQGASDVLEYIPQECFISYDKFDSVADMVVHLRSLTDADIEKYLGSIYHFMTSDKVKIFSPEHVASQIYLVIGKLKKGAFNVLLVNKLLLVARFKMMKASRLMQIIRKEK